MAEQMNIRDLQRLIVTCTSCLALLILVVGTLYGVNTGAISPEHLGNIKNIGVGGGLLGLGAIIVLMVKISIGGGKNK